MVSKEAVTVTESRLQNVPLLYCLEEHLRDSIVDKLWAHAGLEIGEIELNN